MLSSTNTRPKALLALAAVCFLWGTTWVASKEGTRHIPALQLAGMRQLLAGILYVCFFLYKKTPLPTGKEWRAVLLLSFLNFVMSNGLSTWGVKYISAGLGSIMGAIFPLWLVVIGFFTQKERMPGRAIAGLLLGFGGVCIIFYDHLKDFLDPDFRLGVFLSLIATWTWAFATLYTKQQATRFNPYFSLGIQMFLSGLLLTGFTQATGWTIPLAAIPFNAWMVIGYLVFFGSVLSFIAYLYALQHLPTEQASIYAYVNPIVALLCGALLFDERITAFILVGGAVTLLGVWMVNKAFTTGARVVPPENEGV
jgi:drug/metabolite transporter (DMT)-like permease